MTTAKRALMAVGASAATVAIVFALLAVFPVPAIGGLFVVVGLPFAQVILAATPTSFTHELAPQGGPDAVGWAVALGAIGTWFLACFGAWFFVLGRTRSNSTPHTDARVNSVLHQSSSARAGERGRYVA